MWQFKAQGHEVILGSIATFGGQQDARHLFDVEGREYSVAGCRIVRLDFVSYG
jgi:hypothetical protein